MIRTSESLFLRARRCIPGGVNSPVRAFGSVGIVPPFIAGAKRAQIFDVEGREYIDYVCSWGPLILGHADERIVEAVRKASEKGTSFGAVTEREVEFAELITSIYSSVELVRMVSSGTEATMSAVRLARGFTGKNKIIKFDGCYHGHADSFLIKAGSGVLTLGIPGSPGITDGTAADTLVARFNDLRSVEELIDGNKGQIAAVIVEPIMGNAGVILPADGFLQGLRKVTETHGILLIFDEVITGFRVALGGAQGLYGITPDLTCFGKIIGGGFPVGAFGGKRDVMQRLAPVGPVYQAGTLSGNPVAMAAGLETVKILRDGQVYDHLERISAALANGLQQSARKSGLRYTVNRVGSMMCLFFADRIVRSFTDAAGADQNAFSIYFKAMLERGIYLAPSAFEAMFVSAAHAMSDIDRTIEASRESLEEVAKM